MQQFILGVLVGIVMMLTVEHFIVLHATVVAETRAVNAEEQTYYGDNYTYQQPRKEM